MNTLYYNKSVSEVLTFLKTSETGLTTEEVGSRLNQYGHNLLKEKKKINPVIIFLSQFNSIVVYILIGAISISLFLKEYVDAYVILAILIFNAIFGFIQEYRAEKSIEALKKMTSLHATVLRNNQVHKINAEDIVPGDILLLEEGDKIPADCRIIESIHFKTQEAALTGESTSIEKIIESLSGIHSLADQKNIIFAGTIATSGRAKAVVTATGMNMEIGKIATLMNEAEEHDTPLQKNLNSVGRIMGVSVIVICIIVFALSALKGLPLLPAFLASVALAVAAIPEGLPAVITITLAIGVKKMVKGHVLVRKLPSVETLGCTTVICTDKTGTLTKNEMTVRQMYVNNKIIEVTGVGYAPTGDFFIGGKKINPSSAELLLKIGLLNNNAHIEDNQIIGDPTEACLLVTAAKAQLDKEKLNINEKRIEEIIFSSERKRMSTIHTVGAKHVMYTKGAPDILLHLCKKININGKVRALTAVDKKAIVTATNKFSSTALRVLGFAYKEFTHKKITYTEDDETDLVFVGLQAMIDPPRDEVKDALRKCKEAGIRVIMITGDHESTARAIGQELGIGSTVMTGKELATVNLSDVIDTINIFARVNPEHKLKIVEALQKKGHVVAMTGDGVNDAPALKKADIGIAMGITGTNVSKEACHMILTDDNFASIVNAVEEGRGIYGNIKKYFGFLLSGNISEVLIVFLAILLSFPLPLVAAQILLINLVTDGFPALALSVDPYEPSLMKQKPRKKEEKLFKGLAPYIFWYPLTMTIAAVLMFAFVYPTEGLQKAQTMVFCIIAIFELFQALSCRSTIHSAFSVGLFKNKWLIGAVALSASIVLAVVYVPALQQLFDTVSLSALEFATIVLISMSGYVIIEITKAIQNRNVSV
ncbi:MAG: cation-translocating P-type ATPase [Candidatus Woesearchaeota archaeon]|jgi:Ca2+-transporting ATPase